MWRWALIGLLVIAAGVSLIAKQSEENDKAAAAAAREASLTPEQRKEQQRKRAVESEAKAKADRLDGARSACKEFVARTLHDPKSAEFEPTEENWAKDVGGGVYRVQVHLHAKNGFNATRKFVVDCRVRLAGGEWTALSLKEID